MNNHPPTYYEHAKDWYEEKYELIALSRNRYRLLALGLGCLLFLSMASHIAILPLKQYIYRIVEVNRKTGEVIALKELEENRYQTNWVVIRYFLHQYVLNRNLYNLEDVKRTFNIALALSSKSIANTYANQIMDTNPESPLNVLGNQYYKEVKVRGINQLNDHTALVRFTTVTINKLTKNDQKTRELQAVLKWEFKNTTASLKERDMNPFGFFVTYYQESPVNVENN